MVFCVLHACEHFGFDDQVRSCCFRRRVLETHGILAAGSCQRSGQGSLSHFCEARRQHCVDMTAKKLGFLELFGCSM